jgi:hypothetical protein
VTLNWTAALDSESGIDRYRVYRDGAFVTETTTTQFIDSGLIPLTTYRYAVSAINGADLEGPLSGEQLVQTLLDTVAPSLSSIEVSNNGTGLILRFTEDLYAPSAENIGNYQIDPALAVTGAILQPDLRTVVLEVSTMTPGVSYTVTVLGVMDLANTPNSSDDSGAFSYASDPRVSGGLLLLYRFSTGSGTTVFDVSGVGSPMDLNIPPSGNAEWLVGGGLALNGPAFISAASDTKLASNLGASNELTVEAWVRPANTTQTGPARIVTFSEDAQGRNFTVGQRDSRYDVRLRTTVTNANGSNPATQSNTGVVDTVLSHVVYTRNASGVTRIYENGVQVATRTVGGNFANWGTNYVFGLGNEAGVDERPWLGDYHLVAVYDRALNLSEVQQNYIAGSDEELP